MKEKETETIAAYLDEEVSVQLTRREIYWVRKMCKRRMEAARQGMSAPGAAPAKRSMRREEYEFHFGLFNRLYGVDPDESELAAFKASCKAVEALALRQRAERLQASAQSLMAEAQKLADTE